MREDFYVGAYWGPRKETALECAHRAELFFHLLARHDPTFAHWYRRGRPVPRGLPGIPVRPVAEEWEPLFRRGMNYADFPRRVIEELGFSEDVWNAKTSERTRIELHCGGYSPYGPGNTCLVLPPNEGPTRERILSVPVLEGVLSSIATAWDPDFAMASSSEMVSLLDNPHRLDVRVGWLTYVSRRLGTVPPLPAPARIEPVGTLGWLLVLSEEPMTASNPGHVAFTARIRELLDRAGLLARPRPVPDPG